MSNKCPHYDDEDDYDTLLDPKFLHHPAHDWVMDVPISFPWPMVGVDGETELMIQKKWICAKCGATITYMSKVDEETGTPLFSLRNERKLIKAFE
tara:strand:- start:157 stop:441 length:285 start_codon:yes stop_codon:yes gene_type:complete